MEDKNKIAGFISYHNIIRPIELPLFGLPFLSAGCVFMFGTGSISHPDTMEPIVLYIEFFISVILLIAGIVIRKKILKRKEQEPGKCLYLTQMILYIYTGVLSILLVILAVMGAIGVDRVLGSICVSLVFSCIAVAITYVYVRTNIKNGHYLNAKKTINEKVIAFSVSGTCVALYIIVFQFVKSSSTGFGFVVFGLALVTVSSVLAFMYYLKLRYAKKYGLEEYLPKRPHPSPYTGWK